MFAVPLLALQVVVYEEDPALGRWAPGVTVSGRMSFLSGKLSKGDVYYTDNFDEGFGLGVELDLLRVVAPGHRLGLYLGATWDRYDGDAFEDDFGTRVDPGDLDLSTYLIGAKSVIEAGPGIALEGRIGAGAARYESVDAFVVDEFVPLGELEFFDASWEPAFELAGRFGWGTPSVSFGLGLGFRIQGGPEEAGASAFLLDPDTIWLFTIDAGLSLRF